MNQRSRESGNATAAGKVSSSAATIASSQRRARIEQVLRSALVGREDPDLAQAEREVIKHLAAKYPKESLSFDPIAIEIIAALIGAAFHVRMENSPECMTMARVVTGTLWEDPMVRDRLHHMWTSALEGA